MFGYEVPKVIRKFLYPLQLLDTKSRNALGIFLFNYFAASKISLTLLSSLLTLNFFLTLLFFYKNFSIITMYYDKALKHMEEGASR